MTRPEPAMELLAELDGTACVALPEAPTTGYRWQLEDPAMQAHVMSADYVQDGRALAGGTGTRTFRVHLHGLPKLELSFVLRRAWESRVVDRRVVTVKMP